MHRNTTANDIGFCLIILTNFVLVTYSDVGCLYALVSEMSGRIIWSLDDLWFGYTDIINTG